MGNPAAMTNAVSGEILALDRNVIPQQTYGGATLDETLEIAEYARPRFGLILFAVFAVIGLALVSVGVYSVISYSVAQQRHEIGIRMALGASTQDVRAMVVTGGLRFVGIGIGVGTVLAFLVARVLASQVWGVSWYDPLTLGGVVVVLLAVGLAATYLPSIRATRVDPAICLRQE